MTATERGMTMETPTSTTRIHFSKDDKHLKNFTIWKGIYKQLADTHLQHSKNLLDVANNMETTFRNDPDILSYSVMVDIGQVLINELKSQAHVIKDKWENYNEDYQPFDRLSQIDGKSNKSLFKAIQEACEERKALEHKVKHAQKKYFRAFDQTRSLMEKIEMLEDEDILKNEMLSELTSLKSKTDVTLAKYKSTYQNEVDNRDEFKEKMKSIEKLWVKREKDNIETWIDTCNDLCTRLNETSPRCFTNPLDDNSPYPAVIKKLNQIDLDQIVNTALQPKLEQHTFPVYKERRMEDIRTPPGSGTRIHRESQYKYTPDPALLNSFIVEQTSSTNTSSQTTNKTITSSSPPGILITDKTRTTIPVKKKAEETSDKVVDRIGHALREDHRIHGQDTQSSDSDIEVIDLEGSQSTQKTKRSMHLKRHKETNSSSSEEESFTTSPNKHLKSFYNDDLERISNPSSDSSISYMENVYVAVIKDYVKQAKNELNLKIGMQIKQKQCADENGMAYGWYKKNKMSVKKYGYYPVSHVVLLQKSSWMKVNE